MSIVLQGARKRIGLALSGGGFRAAAFHLGVMRKLEELGLLSKIDLLSCVSGGSIAGAFVAANWEQPAKLDRLDAYLRTRSIAVGAVLAGSLDPFETRLDKLAAAYDRDLFNGMKLDALSSGPRLYLNSTNVATGNLFFFVAGADLPAEMGDYELGVVPAGEFRVSRAVAASSAFPPVFPPLVLDTAVYAQDAVHYVALCDGGVYDNMGVNPVVRKRAALDFVIVSDGGKPFEFEVHPTDSGVMVLKAALDIMMEQIRGLQFDRLQHRFLARTGPKPLWFSIDSKEGEVQEGDAAFSSSIRTDLRRLNDDEMKVLTRHGAGLVAARLARYAPELLA